MLGALWERTNQGIARRGERRGRQLNWLKRAQPEFVRFDPSATL